MDKQKKLEFTFHGLLLVAVMCAIFALAVKVIEHDAEIKQCRATSGYVGLEAKAACRR